MVPFATASIVSFVENREKLVSEAIVDVRYTVIDGPARLICFDSCNRNEREMNLSPLGDVLTRASQG